ncbi:Fibronectin type III domain-containing protein [Chitinophaga sp. CF118]|uniref:DUF4082 domain-containing protein n=1 Tax=Chitinophaga sp. CF118 TaxID=1884367 RepID=UPI0008EFBD67|nr:DUF4082 domain-containing protein [Chitinophaga sp. CF118]SFD65648.1 Fibronectin type III domain-containing protein [Chitinophaga sp. CF118]
MRKTYPLGSSTAILSLFIGSCFISCKRDLVVEGKVKGYTISAGSYSVFTTERPLQPVSDNPAELGMKFKSAVPGTITKFLYYKVAGETGTHTGHLWSASGGILKTVAFTAETDTGWQTATLDTPYHISSNTIYVISVNSVSKYAATNYGLASVITNGPLSTIADKNGVYIYTPGSFPNDYYQSTNYFRDVEFTPDQNDQSPPSAPGNLTVSNITSNSATLSWSASTDNVGVTGYEVYRNGILIDTLPPTSLLLNNSKLNAAAAYSFYVKAKDAFGNRSVASNLADFSTINPGSITSGTQLTTSMVGPTGISISSLTTVSGGTFTGAPLSGWGSLARTVATGGEMIDGFWFPAGTVVLQGANISSLINVSSGWLVLRGCKGGILANHPAGNGGGAAALYCELTSFATGGLKDSQQPVASIVHRCYLPHNGLENVYANNITVTESWITPDPDITGSEHIDGIQTWGGQYYLNFSRNHMEFNSPYNSSLSGLLAMYSDGAQNGFSGYDHVMVNDNYFIINSTGIALHAPLAVPVTNMIVTGNRWKGASTATDLNYTNAVYNGPRKKDRQLR